MRPPQFKSLSLKVSTQVEREIRLGPATLSTGFQPLASELMTYSQKGRETTLAMEKSNLPNNVFCLSLIGRDYALDGTA